MVGKAVTDVTKGAPACGIGLPPTRKTVRELLQAEVEAMGGDAAATLKTLVKGKTGLDQAEKRLADVCLGVLDRCGVGKDAPPASSFNDLSADELAALLDQIEGTLAGRARDVSAPTLDSGGAQAYELFGSD